MNIEKQEKVVKTTTYTLELSEEEALFIAMMCCRTASNGNKRFGRISYEMYDKLNKLGLCDDIHRVIRENCTELAFCLRNTSV